MGSSKAINTPMSTSTKLEVDESGESFDQKTYRGMIGSLLYLTATRPDIMFSVGLCARFQSNPKIFNLKAVKRILRYLKCTTNLGLWYLKTENFELIAYADADFAGCRLDRKSTSGTCQFLGHSLISWSSKKQNSVVLSTTEAEYIAASACCAQVVWMKNTLEDYKVHFKNIFIQCDNTSAICLTKNLIQHSRTKHIDIRHHFIRDHITNHDVIDTKHQLADIFTKPLSKEQFDFIKRELGMLICPNV